MEDTDYCSKHADEIILCDICGNPLLGSTYVEYDGDGELRQYCERCHQAFQTCQLCPSFQKCEYMTNPDPMPKVVMKTVRQGHMQMQTQVMNPDRVNKFCLVCGCYDKELGCKRQLNVACDKKTEFWTSRNS
jgi:hypothetical protein